MSFNSFLRILLARWLLISGITVVCIGVTLAVTLQLPKNYTASVKLIVDDKSRDLVSGQRLSAGRGHVATQIDIMTSRNVLSRVYGLLEADEQALVRQFAVANDDSGPREPAELVTGLLSKNLKAAPGRDSSVVTLSVRHENPQLAALFANTAADAYMSAALELRTDPAQRYSDWYTEQLELLREDLRQARSALSDYRKENGIVAVDERLDVESSRLRELSSMLVEAQGQRLLNESRRSQSNTSQWREAGVDVMESSVVQGLRAELGQAEAKLEELSSRLGARHPEYIQANAEVLTLRSRIAAEAELIGSGIESATAFSAAREEELAKALEEQKRRVLELGAQKDDLALLQQEVAMAEEAYNAASARTNATRLESRLAESDVSVLSQAVAPSIPSDPDMRLNLVLASALGSLLGIGLALIAELSHRRVRSRADIEDVLGLPVLAYLPEDRRRWLKTWGVKLYE